LNKILQVLQVEESARRTIEQANLDAEQAVDDAREQALILIAEAAKATEKKCDDISEQIHLHAHEKAEAIREDATTEASFVRTEARPRIPLAVDTIIETLKG
jgi:vacuolar-type H+-ATPase subunit H